MQRLLAIARPAFTRSATIYRAESCIPQRGQANRIMGGTPDGMSPPIADNERLCARCSLAPVCLPEEVRHEPQAEHDPVRLFPPDRDGATLHVVSQGAQVGCSGDSLVVRPRDQPETKHAIHGIESILLHGFAPLTTQALRKCVEHGIGVHWLSTSGYHTASLTPTAGQVQRRIRQYRALTDEALCLRLARHWFTPRSKGSIVIFCVPPAVAAP